MCISEFRRPRASELVDQIFKKVPFLPEVALPVMPKILVVISALFISLGGFLFGYELGIVSSTLAQPHFISYFGNPSDAVTGAIVSCYTGMP